MQQTAAARHIDEVIASVTDHTGDRSQHTPDDLIERSWLRCVHDHGLDPSRAQPARIIENARLREHQEQAESFLRVARSGMEQLFKRVSPLGYVLLLTDAHGVTVDYIGNDTWDHDLRHSGLYLGSDWNEAHAGTCAVGTCIVEQTPLTCHRADHFDSSHIALTCSAAPLFDPNGEFMGVLDISALTSPEAHESQHLARHMTVMFGQMIEDANFIRHFRDHWILRLGNDWALVDVNGECMLAFDVNGVIVGANSGARRVLSATDERGALRALVGSHLTEVFKATMDELWRVARAGTTSDRTLLTTHAHGLFYAMASPPRPGARRAAIVPDRPADPASCLALDNLARGDKQMDRLIDQAKRLVNKRVNILLHGETGTGKEVVARALHDSSTRARQPFVPVNCASIPESLIESELFGYTAGSFTGGRSKGMKGLILQSDGGTLFLDEIGDMPLTLQTRLLRVIAEREVMPLGADRPVPVDLTVVAASHRDLRRLIAEGLFREDLYYRLCGATLHLPPLRVRTDKPFIIGRVLEQEARLMELGSTTLISPDATRLLLAYDWPGNIRQLRNVIRFALAICDDDYIEVAHLPHELQLCGSTGATGFDEASHVPQHLAQLSGVPAPTRSEEVSEASELHGALRRHRWNVTAVAKELAICRATVYRQMKRYGIVPPNYELAP